MKKKIIFGIVAVVLFSATSFTVSVVKKSDVFPGAVHIQLAGMSPTIGASTNWAGVRGSATFIRSVARGIDSLITSLNSSGILSQSGTVGPFTSGTSKFRLTTNSTATANDATGATPTYTKLFQICTNGSLALELYLTSASAPASNGGAVVVWQPKLFDSTLASSANIKCSFGTVAGLGASANGKNGMVCTWYSSTPFDGAATGIDRARILAFDDTTNNQIKMVGLAQINADLACPTTNDQYTLAYIASKTSPYNTTAKWGWNNTGSYSAANFATFCAGSTNTTNAGIFNINVTGYFVNDGVTDATVPSGYPTPSSVDTLIANEASVGASGTLPAALINFPSTSTTTASCPF